MLSRCHTALAAPVLMCATGAALAHHSYAEFDDRQIVEIEGALRTANWINPHANLEVDVTDGNGTTIVWDIETLPRNYLTRTGIPLESFVIGGTVKVAGWQSKRNPNRMYATNLLSADGREMVWRTAPRWSETAYVYGTDGGTATEASSIFRVWGSVYGPPRAQTLSALAGPDAPLTESARKSVQAFDPVNDTTTRGCDPKGMPQIMFIPAPMEILDRGDTILIRIEEYDSVREIHLAPPDDRELRPKTRLGYSTGRWDGRSLVVDTNSVETPFLNSQGVPLGSGARFVERFTPSYDGSRLDYKVEITAPEALTQPVVMERSWVFRPGERVLPFDCVE
jgi:hypothetical protein